MKASEIRETPFDSSDYPQRSKIIFLREIAAQLAELNESLTKIVNHLGDLNVTVYKS